MLVVLTAVIVILPGTGAARGGHGGGFHGAGHFGGYHYYGGFGYGARFYGYPWGWYGYPWWYNGYPYYYPYAPQYYYPDAYAPAPPPPPAYTYSPPNGSAGGPGEWVTVPGQRVNGVWVPEHKVRVPAAGK